MIENMEEICRHLNRDGVVIYPTDTLYGMGALAFNHTGAILKIIRLKRMESMPAPVFSVAFPDISTMQAYVRIPDFLRNYFPAPLTVIAESYSRWDYLTLNGKMAARIPDNGSALEILRECGPLTATSANIHGGSNLDINGIKEVFGNEDDILIIDGEKPRYMEQSTIIDIVDVRLVRQGVFDAGSILSRLRSMTDDGRDAFPPDLLKDQYM